VLEVLVGAATPTTSAQAVGASVRSVAAELGISKNSAQRAFTVLRQAGLIIPQRQARENGRFQSGRYILQALRPAPVFAPRVAHHAAELSSDAVQQLTLLPPD
jgi:DNA-binding transcriptional regulator YhcF (GntR family)